jgi:hypothetical protein
MFLECNFSFRGQLAVEVPRAKNVRTNTDTPLIFSETVHRWDKTETLSSKSKTRNGEPRLRLGPSQFVQLQVRTKPQKSPSYDNWRTRPRDFRFDASNSAHDHRLLYERDTGNGLWDLASWRRNDGYEYLVVEKTPGNRRMSGAVKSWAEPFSA